MDIDYSLDASRIDIEAVWRMLRSTCWSPNIRREVVAKAIANSVVIGAYEGTTGKQVGFARGDGSRAVCVVV